MGEKYFLSTVAGELAQAVYAQGRYAEAEELTRVAEELSAEDDLTSQRSGGRVGRRSRGAGSARRRRLALEAVDLLEGTDALAGRRTRSWTSPR